MKKLIIAALILAIITGFSVYYYFDSVEKSFRVETLPVVVAKIKIDKNTKITSDMISVRQLPIVAVNALSVKNISEINGRVALEDLEVGEQILSTKVSNPDKTNNSLFYTIKDGYRAFTIKTDEITGVAGYINKGDFIDIVAITTNPLTSGLVSLSVVENIEVIEVGTKSQDAASGTYSSVTVLVKSEDVLKLNYILSEGKYRIVARSVTEKNEISPKAFVP